MRIDDLLADWHVRERHHVATTAAAAADLLAAVEQVTWAEVPVMRVLMRVRSAGRLRLGPDRPILEDMARLGFTMLARTGNELVAAAIGRPWSPAGGRGPRLADQLDPARFFVDFSAPGWAKMITNFRVSAGELTTETRVLLTDERSRRAFRRYWLVIRPFSGLIRRRWLAAIVRRASQGVGQ